MWFKQTYSLAGMHLSQPTEAPVRIPLPAGEDGEVVLWLRNIDDDNDIAPQLCCDALINRAIKPDVSAMFHSLSNDILPQVEPMVVELPHHLGIGVEIDAAGNIPKNWNIPLDIMPLKFQSLSRDLSSELSDLGQSFVKTLRWVQGASGKQSPFSHVAFQWSTDKVCWRNMPHNYSVRIEQPMGIDISPNALERVSAVWAKGEEEPLGHELMREAFDIAGSNPRSALLIGVSAHETGLKNYVHFRVPNSHIILEKMPSPPALTIVQEVIPALHESLEVHLPGSPLGKTERDFLRKWISQRNLVAHGVKKAVNVDELLSFLSFVRTLLYRLDVCRGQNWANSLVSAGKATESASVN